MVGRGGGGDRGGGAREFFFRCCRFGRRRVCLRGFLDPGVESHQRICSASRMWVRGCEQRGGPLPSLLPPQPTTTLSRRRAPGPRSPSPHHHNRRRRRQSPPPCLSSHLSSPPLSPPRPGDRRPMRQRAYPNPAGSGPAGGWGARGGRGRRNEGERRTRRKKERQGPPPSPPPSSSVFSPTCGFWWALRRVLTVRAAPGAAEGIDEGAASISLSLSLSPSRRSPPAAAVPVRGIPLFFFCSLSFSAESGICYVCVLWGSQRMKGAAVCGQGLVPSASCESV